MNTSFLSFGGEGGNNLKTLAHRVVAIGNCNECASFRRMLGFIYFFVLVF